MPRFLFFGGFVVVVVCVYVYVCMRGQAARWCGVGVRSVCASVCVSVHMCVIFV